MPNDNSLISETPLDDNKLSAMERAAAALIIGAAILFLGAIVGENIAPDNALTENVQKNFLDPLNQDSTQGDAGYNPVDTIAYSLLLVSFVVVISAWLRRMKIPARDASLLALIPWVVWAALGEVNEDGVLFSDRFGVFFVSPVVHFHVAIWVVFVGLMSHCASRSSTVGGRQAVTQMAVMIFLFQAVIFFPQFMEFIILIWKIKNLSYYFFTF